MGEIFAQVMAMDKDRIFYPPVDPLALHLPHYSRLVPHPMDLSTIEARLAKGMYGWYVNCRGEFSGYASKCACPPSSCECPCHRPFQQPIFDDLTRVFTNAITYNPLSSRAHQLAKQILSHIKVCQRKIHAELTDAARRKRARDAEAPPKAKPRPRKQAKVQAPPLGACLPPPPPPPQEQISPCLPPLPLRRSVSYQDRREFRAAIEKFPPAKYQQFVAHVERFLPHSPGFVLSTSTSTEGVMEIDVDLEQVGDETVREWMQLFMPKPAVTRRQTS